MATLSVSLLGRFCVRRGDQIVQGLDARRVQELFSYLLLHRGHPQCREALAGLLWGDSPTAQSRKYLRQALWQLQAALDSRSETVHGRALRVESEWVDLNAQADLRLDVAVLEQTFALVEGVSSRELDGRQVQSLQQAVQLYKGDLLEGCYLDWCIYERERLQILYLAMLDKLMGYCETRHEYDNALVYGMRILGHDRASERTHRRLMRLQYLAGDRTAALRQYERCAAALAEELGVQPSRHTRALYDQLRADQLDSPSPAEAEAAETPGPAVDPLLEVIGRLNQFLAILTNVQGQVQQQIEFVELARKRRR